MDGQREEQLPRPVIAYYPNNGFLANGSTAEALEGTDPSGLAQNCIPTSLTPFDGSDKQGNGKRNACIDETTYGISFHRKR